MFLNMCKPFLQYSGVSETYFLKIVLLTLIFSPPILCFSQEDFPNFQPKSVTPLEMFPWHIRFRDLFIYVCTECLAEFNLIMEWKMLILHCEASENVVGPLLWRPLHEKWRQILYLFCHLWKTDTAFYYLPQRCQGEKKKKHSFHIYLNQAVLRKHYYLRKASEWR